MNPIQRLVVVHADESCLGNQSDEPSRGGAGALIEMNTPGGISRKDFFVASHATTNNQMALTGAIEVLRLLLNGVPSRPILYHSDSQYLVKGITEWAHNWERSGWRRKGGPVQNLARWQELLPLSRSGTVRWQWVRGHAGHVKNEYSDYLAVRSAEQQSSSDGLAESEFLEWLAQQQSAGKFSGYDPNTDFEQIALRHTAEA